MLRRSVQCGGVFVLGLLLALGIAYFTNRPSSAAFARTTSFSPLGVVNAEPLAPRAPIAWTQATLPKNPESLGESDASELTSRLQNMPAEVRQAFLVEAVRDGSAASLRNISSRSMSVLPDYRKEILPALKRESLSVLVSRFRDGDWTNWAMSAYARDGGPTPARSYVDLVFAANPELGRFLETGAQLFHRLYVVTEEGKVFTPQEELLHVLAAAEQASSQRAHELILASRLLDAGILQDPVFGIIFEQLRAQLVGNFVHGNRNDPLGSLELLLSVHPAVGAAELSPEYVRIFRLFALDATARYRKEVFERLQEATHLETLAKNDPALGRSLAELYLVGGMDAIEVGDQARALLFIDQSNRYFAGLRAQELLAELIRIRNQPREETRRVESAPSEPEKKAEAAPAAEQPKLLSLREKSPSGLQSSLRAGMSFLSVTLLVGIVLAALFFVFIYWRSVQTLNTSPLPSLQNEPNVPVQMTSPTEMNFGEEPEIERRLANG